MEATIFEQVSALDEGIEKVRLRTLEITGRKKLHRNTVSAALKKNLSEPQKLRKFIYIAARTELSIAKPEVVADNPPTAAAQ